MKTVKDYLEKKYLEYQLENGRATLGQYADYLGVSRPYITMLMVRHYLAISQADIEAAHKRASPADNWRL